MIIKCKVQWCHVNALTNTDNKKYKPCWKTNIIPINDAEEAKLTTLGVERHEDDGVGYYRTKRNEKKKSTGETVEKPVCVDKSRNNFTGNVGNGSVCNVQVSPFDYDGETYLYFQGIQVLELVSFGAADGAEFEDETGASEFTDESKDKSKDEGTGEDCPF